MAFKAEIETVIINDPEYNKAKEALLYSLSFRISDIQVGVGEILIAEDIFVFKCDEMIKPMLSNDLLKLVIEELQEGLEDSLKEEGDGI